MADAAGVAVVGAHGGHWLADEHEVLVGEIDDEGVAELAGELDGELAADGSNDDYVSVDADVLYGVNCGEAVNNDRESLIVSVQARSHCGTGPVGLVMRRMHMMSGTNRNQASGDELARKAAH